MRHYQYLKKKSPKVWLGSCSLKGWWWPPSASWRSVWSEWCNYSGESKHWWHSARWAGQEKANTDICPALCWLSSRPHCPHSANRLINSRQRSGTEGASLCHFISNYDFIFRLLSWPSVRPKSGWLKSISGECKVWYSPVRANWIEELWDCS